jgi:uncharacterized protein DUF2330
MRSRQPLAFTAGVLASVWAVLFAASPARPCAPAPPPGRHVDIFQEEAIVVWDQERHLEHFIRRASFRSEAPDFGFLVPSPSRPELAEAPDDVFGKLDQATQPRRVTESEYEFMVCTPMQYMMAASEAPTTAMRPPVRVLETRHVAGYDAAVLKADDAGALNAWLANHGYATRPELESWLEFYVRSGWVLTAFKIAAPEGGGTEIGSSAVRMSFGAERPFFPYREPEDQRREGSPQRLLRVFFVGPQRVEARLGDAGRPWPGSVRYSSEPGQAVEALFGAVLPPGQRPAGRWLTELVDESTPRPGTDDLYFVPAGDQSRIEPPPIVRREHVPIPLDLLALALLVVYLIVRGVRRMRRGR